MRLAIIGLLVCGCSAGASRTSPPGSGHAVATACPAEFGATGLCDYRDACTYPQGTCTCAPPPNCEGAMPEHPPPPEWRCVAAVAADGSQGCPPIKPSNGSACVREGLACDYTCSCAQSAECRGGIWVTTDGPCKS